MVQAQKKDLEGSRSWMNLGDSLHVFGCPADNFVHLLWFEPNEANNRFAGRGRKEGDQESLIVICLLIELYSFAKR